MFNYLRIKIEGKDVKRFVLNLIKRGVKFENLDLYKHVAYLKVDYPNYLKITSIKTIYEIEIVQLYGFLYIKDLIKRYYIFFIFLIYGIILYLFLSNIIFSVEVIHSKSEVRSLVMSELKERGIDRFKFVKSFDEQEKIVSDILDKNKDSLEWLEIDRVGVKYVVRVEERIIKKEVKKTENRSIIASKTGVIKKIEASKGEVLKKVNDYVKKGDVLISGNITKNDEVKNVVSATGVVYAEVWYQVKVDVPINYKREYLTDKKRYNASLCFLDHCLYLFKPFAKSDNYSVLTLGRGVSPFNISLFKEEEKKVFDTIYSEEELSNIGLSLAREKMDKIIGKEGKVLGQKKLKNTYKDSTMEVVVFFRVYENITAYSKVEIKEEKKE